MHSLRPSTLLLCAVCLLQGAHAQTPTVLFHQGKIAVEGQNFTGTGQFKFVLHALRPDASGTPEVRVLWGNHSSNPNFGVITQPNSAVEVPVDRGLFSVRLGDTNIAGMRLITRSLAPGSGGQRLFLRTWFSDGIHGFQELQPDLEIGEVPVAGYAHHAAGSDIAEDSITPSMIRGGVASGTVTLGANFTNDTVRVVTGSYGEYPVVETGIHDRYVAGRDNFGITYSLPPMRVTADAVEPNVVGRELSMTVVGGNPAIAYLDSTSGDLKFVRATTRNGSAWGTPVLVHIGGANLVGRHPSLGVIDGAPAIAYYDATQGDLLFVRANNSSGSSWGTPVVVASAGNVGEWCRLLIPPRENPIILCYNRGKGQVELYPAVDPKGAAWSSMPLVIDGGRGADAGEYVDAALIGGVPAVVYRHATENSVRYAEAANARGSSWEEPMIVESEVEGREFSLATVFGSPAVAYMDEGHLVYERAATFQGSWRWDVVPTSRQRYIDRTGSLNPPPGSVCLREIDGRPSLAYTSGLYVWFTQWDASLLQNWRTPERQDATPTGVPFGVAMAEVEGQAALAYSTGEQDPAAALKFTTAVPGIVDGKIQYRAYADFDLVARSIPEGSVTRDTLSPTLFGTGSVYGEHALALGSRTVAVGDDSLAGGEDTSALGTATLAFGTRSLAMAPSSIALGAECEARDGVAIGEHSVADGSGAAAFGRGLVAGVQQVVVGQYNEPSNDLFVVGGGGAPTTRRNALVIQRDGDLVVIANAFKPGGGSWSTASDARLKDVGGSFDKGLEALAAIEPVTYRYREDNPAGFPSDETHVGVVAQVVEEVLPEAVTTNEDGYRLVNNDPILWTMLNAIKELKAEIDERKSEIADLRSEVRRLSEGSFVEGDRQP